MQDLINEAAAIIKPYNAELAEAWKSQPFRRVNLARGFIYGFMAKAEDGEAPRFAWLVLRVALLDQRARKNLLETP